MVKISSLKAFYTALIFETNLNLEGIIFKKAWTNLANADLMIHRECHQTNNSDKLIINEVALF